MVIIPSRDDGHVLQFCLEPQSIVALMESMGWSDRTKFRQRHINRLLERGLLQMTMPDKPKSRLQQYVVTEQGRDLIKKGP